MVHFLCYSDTHGQPPRALAGGAPAAILHAGDVYDEPAAEQSAALADWLKQSPATLYAVRGNHDTADPLGLFAPGRDATGQVLPLGSGLWLAGLGWHGRHYSDRPSDAQLRELTGALRRQVEARLAPGDRLLLLTHYPPPPAPGSPLAWPSSPGQYVCEAVGDLIAATRPLAVVAGHVHEWFGQSERRGPGGETLLLCPGPQGCLLRLDLTLGRAEADFAPRTIEFGYKIIK